MVPMTRLRLEPGTVFSRLPSPGRGEEGVKTLEDKEGSKSGVIGRASKGISPCWSHVLAREPTAIRNTTLGCSSLITSLPGRGILGWGPGAEQGVSAYLLGRMEEGAFSRCWQVVGLAPSSNMHSPGMGLVVEPVAVFPTTNRSGARCLWGPCVL